MTRQLTVRLSDETYEALVRLAEHEDRAPAVVVRMAVMRHLALSPRPLSPGYASPTSPALLAAQAVAEMAAPAAKSPASTPNATHLPCGHSKVLLRGGLCRGCNPMVPG